jgi:hypothetical protein
MVIDEKINKVLYGYRDCNLKSGAVRKQLVYELVKLTYQYLYEQEEMLTNELRQKQNRINELENA